MTPAIFAMLALPMIGFPLLFNWIASRIEARIENSRDWNAIDGVIVRSKAYQTKGVWRPSLVYSYEVQGSELRSSRYCFGDFTGTREEVQALVAAHPEGSAVKVYYDPTKPKFAVLERTGQAGVYRLAGWALGVIFLALLVIIYFAVPVR